MSFKTVTSVIGVEHNDSDLRTAVEFCRYNHAHLTVLVASYVPSPPVGDVRGSGYSAWSFQWQDEDKRLEERSAKLHELLKTEKVSFNIELLYSLRSTIDEDIAVRVRYTDVTLIGSHLMRDNFLFKNVLEGALFQSPAPVIVHPEDAPLSSAPRTIVLAWNDSNEAGRAMRSSMDLLARADSVHLLMIDPTLDDTMINETPAESIVTFLERHGVRAKIHSETSFGSDVGTVICDFAKEVNAELLVMGGYGHSRLRERIFGGVTKSVLEALPLPVLFAH